ncbi:MAG: hypothetical protein K2Y05_06330 [Hyphomicrobiaceae bacterium]|nr:hypothetical protein [Hyphomicrobiaceae bacterium]
MSLNDLRDRTVGQAVGMIAAAMAVSASAGQIDIALAKLAASWPLPQPESLPSDDAADGNGAFRKTLVGYGLSATHRQLDSLDWDPELLQLFSKNRSGAKFDLTGPPRLISHGPNFGVPVGQWTVEIDFTTSDCFSASLLVRVVSKALLAEGGFTLPVHGSHRLQISFTVEDAQFPIELHFLSNESCIEGRMHIDRLHLARTVRA